MLRTTKKTRKQLTNYNKWFKKWFLWFKNWFLWFKKRFTWFSKRFTWFFEKNQGFTWFWVHVVFET